MNDVRDLYLRRSDSTSGAQVVTQHRVWDADRFVASQQAQARKDGEKDNTPGRYRVEIASAEDYRRAH